MTRGDNDVYDSGMTVRWGARSWPEAGAWKGAGMRPRIFLLRPKLGPGERVLRTWHANWLRRGIARGGTLNLTDRRLLFQPNSVESLILRAESWDRSQLRGTELVEGRRRIGTWKRRMGVVLLDGEVVEFVVWAPEAAVRELAALLADGPASC